MANEFFFTVFTKPWRTQSIEELALLTKGLGFDGIELPLRDGYQVDPARAVEDLPRMAEQLRAQGLRIGSVASGTQEHIFEACAKASIPLIRIMFGNGPGRDYMEAEARMKKEIEAFLPLCERYNVKVGVQHHYGRGINNSMEMLHLLEGYDPALVGAIWDAAHSGLAGEEPEQAIDTVWSHLCLVNFKNAIYLRKNGPEAAVAEYDRYFTTGSQGLCSWARALRHLMKRGYGGNICLPAEYTDGDNVKAYAAQDLAFIKKLAEEI